MTFNKPQGVTFTQMAQWVDSYGSETNDNDRLVEYLYHIVYSTATKHSLFNDYEMYDDFSLYCVTKLLTRFSNKDKDPVKSVTNYLKTVLTLWKAEYVRCFCCGSPDIETSEFNVTDFADYLIDAASFEDYKHYNFYSLEITDVIRQHLSKIPQKKNSSEWCNIYTSCLLTLRDRIFSAVMLCNNSKDKHNSLSINRTIRNLKIRPPILFHLDNTYASYISVLVNEIVHALSAELTYTTHSDVSVSSCLKNLVTAANNEEEK